MKMTPQNRVVSGYEPA